MKDPRQGDGALAPDDLAAIARRTVAHYDRAAESFREGTQHHDVSQNIAALLEQIEGTPPFTILDFGCGPGRDLLTFQRLGHQAVGLEGAARFVEMARRLAGCEVLHQDFLRLDLPSGRFDGIFHGIFANASLFHVPTQELPRVLRQLHAALRPRGVLFSSNPRGDNREGWSGGERYGVYHDLAGWRRFLDAAGFDELLHYFRPAGLPPEQQPWLASVWRRRDSSG